MAGTYLAIPLFHFLIQSNLLIKLIDKGHIFVMDTFLGIYKLTVGAIKKLACIIPEITIFTGAL